MVSRPTSPNTPVSIGAGARVPRGLRVLLRRFVIALAVTSTLVVVAVAAAGRFIDAKIGAIRRVHVTTVAGSTAGENFLLVGSDTRAGAVSAADETALCDPVQGCESGQRSDTIMVLHVEPAARTALLVSFPRDLLVAVPGIGESKINAAFNSDLGGGPQRVIDTLAANFGIEVNHYVAVDFNAFRGAVNAIGALRLAFPYPTRDEYSGLSVPEAGCVAVSGDAALAYVRARSYQIEDPATGEWRFADAVPDVGRIRRQQAFVRDVLTVVVKKSLANPLTANQIADRIVGDLTLDQAFTEKELVGLIGAFRTVDANDPARLDTETFPWHEGPLFEGQSVLYPQDDTPAGQALLARLKDFGDSKSAGEAVKPTSIKVKVLNASGRPGVAAATRADLVRRGFRGFGSPSNDPRGQIAQTEVRYPTGERIRARSVLKYVAPAAKLVEEADLRKGAITLVIGQDFQGIVGPPAASSALPPASSGAQSGGSAVAAAPNGDATPC